MREGAEDNLQRIIKRISKHFRGAEAVGIQFTSGMQSGGKFTAVDGNITSYRIDMCGHHVNVAKAGIDAYASW